MTTDVINGVPRSLLRLLADSAEHGYGIDNENLEVARALLATAQPADHSEHDLNMVSQPAADGERESHWFSLVMNAAAELETASYSIQDAEAKRIARSGADHYRAKANETRQARAAQLQQAVAVTDEVRSLREALEELLGCPHNVVQATVPKAGIEAAPPYQVVLDVSVSLTRWRKAQAALSAHKTGEE